MGVGVAIATGGPGALFWMWASALLGMMTVYAENVLAARHRQAPGALGYIRAAGRWGKPLAAVYAGGCCLSSLGMGTMAQTHAAAASLSTLGVPGAVSALGLGLLAFWVARGGLALGAKITQRLVPLMTLLFFGASLWVLWVFRENIPRAFASIFQGAFSLKAGAGGAAGALLALRTGVSRGVFTNEAGLGTSAMAHGAAQVDHPARQGMWGIFEVFCSTLVVCTVTALVILVSGAYDPEAALVQLQTGTVPDAAMGVPLTARAFSSVLGPAGTWAVSLSLVLFAFSSILGWSCYGQQSLRFLTGGDRLLPAYRAVFLLCTVLGAVADVSPLWQLVDLCNALMALPNLAALLLLAPRALSCLAEWERAQTS